MRRLIIALAIASIPGLALAGAWDSGMVEDEGGPAMMAWVYGEGGGDVPPELRMMCGDGMGLRYGMGSGPGEGIEPIMDPLDFEFDFGTEKLVLEMQYEGMDGMYAAYFPMTAKVIGLLKSSSGVRVSDPTGTYHAQPFSLEGSSRAIDALLKTCG